MNVLTTLGPCTPVTTFISMSAVLLGPLIIVTPPPVPSLVSAAKRSIRSGTICFGSTTASVQVQANHTEATQLPSPMFLRVFVYAGGHEALDRQVVVALEGDIGLKAGGMAGAHDMPSARAPSVNAVSRPNDRRRRGTGSISTPAARWIPAFAGMTMRAGSESDPLQ